MQVEHPAATPAIGSKGHLDKGKHLGVDVGVVRSDRHEVPFAMAWWIGLEEPSPITAQGQNPSSAGVRIVKRTLIWRRRSESVKRRRNGEADFFLRQRSASVQATALAFLVMTGVWALCFETLTLSYVVGGKANCKTYSSMR